MNKYDEMTTAQREKEFHRLLDEAVKVCVAQKRQALSFSADLAGSLLAFITCMMRMLGVENMRVLFEQAGNDLESTMDRAAQEAFIWRYRKHG